TGRWYAPSYSYAEAEALSSALGLSITTASVLARRGLVDEASARRFLEGQETHDPFEFRGIEVAVELVLTHVRRKSLIAIHGDYDVDGVCSTALLTGVLRRLGATVMPRLPSRTEDGYGLSAEAVRKVHGQGASLLLTV